MVGSVAGSKDACKEIMDAANNGDLDAAREMVTDGKAATKIACSNWKASPACAVSAAIRLTAAIRIVFRIELHCVMLLYVLGENQKPQIHRKATNAAIQAPTEKLIISR